MMSFEEFVIEVTARVQRAFTGNYEVTVQEVINNNSTPQCMLMIHENNRQVGSAVHLLELYKNYIKAPEPWQLTTITDSIIQHIWQHHENMYRMANLANGVENYQNIKDRILFKLVNTKDNLKLLEQVPHVPYLDLSVVFFICLAITEEEGIISSLIKNEHAQCWGIAAEELYQEAEKNTPKILRVEFKPLREVLADMGEDLVEDELSIPGMEIGKAELFMLSNTERCYGASVLLYPDVLKTYAEPFHSDLIVVPSSIHEVLLIPCTDMTDVGYISAFVSTVNTEIVPREDWLSDHAYIYHYQENQLTMV